MPKISSYPAATSGADADKMLIVQGGVTRNILLSVLKTFFGSGIVDPTPDTDHTANGPQAVMTAGEALAFRDVCYQKSDGKWWKADADAATTMPVAAMALASIEADANGLFALPGAFVRDDSLDTSPAPTIGTQGRIYASTDPGAITQAAPSGSGDQVQDLGYHYSASVIYFNPSPTIIEIQ